MKVIFFLVATLSFSFASPSFDWEKIRPKNVYFETKSNVSTPIHPRIIGGKEVVPHSKPYQAAIVIDSSVFCGGSLISPRFVLTAAHCIEGHAYFQIILGAHDIREEEPTQIVVTSTVSIVHPDYNPVNLNNDVGLIRLPYEVELNDNIRTIKLAPENSLDFSTRRVNVSGWGRLSDESTGLAPALYEALVTVMYNSICVLHFNPDIIISSTICTLGLDYDHNAVGTCVGDSGGPLVYGEKQIGVVSFSAAAGCEKESPSGYARVTKFWSWINEYVVLE